MKNKKLYFIEKLISSKPTEEQIEEVLNKVDADSSSYIILSETDMIYMQATGDIKDGYYIEYQENSNDNHFESDGLYSYEITKKLFNSYLNNSDEWKKIIPWKKEITSDAFKRNRFMNKKLLLSIIGIIILGIVYYFIR